MSKEPCRKRSDPAPGFVRRRHSLLVLTVLALLPSACGAGGDDADAGAEGAVEGVSQEEMVGQAAPMTLEQAESLGIVDTTITVGDPVGPDSLIVPSPGNRPETSVP